MEQIFTKIIPVDFQRKALKRSKNNKSSAHCSPPNSRMSSGQTCETLENMLEKD